MKKLLIVLVIIVVCASQCCAQETFSNIEYLSMIRATSKTIRDACADKLALSPEEEVKLDAVGDNGLYLFRSLADNFNDIYWHCDMAVYALGGEADSSLTEEMVESSRRLKEISNETERLKGKGLPF